MSDDRAGPYMANSTPDVGFRRRSARGPPGDRRQPGEFNLLTATAKSGLIHRGAVRPPVPDRRAFDSRRHEEEGGALHTRVKQ